VLVMLSHEAAELAERVAKKAVAETFLMIGVDTSDPLSVQRDFAVMREVGRLALDPEFRKDIEHTRKWRLALEAIQVRGITAAIGIIIAGFVGALWLGVKTALGK
jgi:hypothetical protein